MKRSICAAAIAGTFLGLGPGIGSADPGSVQAGARGAEDFLIDFKVVKNRHGNVKKIKDLAYENVELECEKGGSIDDYGAGGGFDPVDVERNRFKITYEWEDVEGDASGNTLFKGKVQDGQQSVSGILRHRADYPSSGLAGCDSDKLPWFESID